MMRVIGSVALLVLTAPGAAAQTATAQTATPLPPDLASHSPTEVLAQGRKNLNDLIAMLDKQADNVAVRIDDTSVTDGEVADELRGYPPSVGYVPLPDIYKLALENVMRQRALAIEAKQAGIDKDPSVQRRIREATDRVLVAEYMRKQIEPKLTDAALRARYAAEIAGKPGPLEVHVRVILLTTPADALDALARVKADQDFASVAKDMSKDASASVGGDLGWVPRDAVDPAIGAVAFAMNPGEMSANPVEGAAGWYLIKNEGIRQREAPTFEMVRDQLRHEMVAEDAASIRANMPAKITVGRGKIPVIDLDQRK